MFRKLEGDKNIWGVIILITGFSFLPAYSASSNLGVNTTTFLIKHMFLLGFGFGVMYLLHKVNIKYLKNLPLILLPLTWILLLVTLATGMTIGDANASRWITVPIVGISFQTSELAKIVLLLFVSRYVYVKRGEYGTFKESLRTVFLPIGAMLRSVPCSY
jgi:cell division protein FtsW